MVCIGAGVIGVELASVYRRLGTEITIIEMLDRVCPGMDLTICKALHQIFKKQGLIFHLSTQVTGAKVKGKKVTVSAKEGDKDLSFTADVVLVAVGRRPYTKGLGLEAVGIEPDKRGFININGNFQTSQPNIYAIGDIIEGPMLAHRASHEGIAVAEALAGHKHTVNYMSIPNVIYTHPEVATVGLTEEEAKEVNFNLITGTSFFKGNARARCAGETDGFVKVIGEATSKRLIGMHIVGPHASEMIGEGVIAIDKKAKIDDIAHGCHAHPTLSETIMEAAQQALGKAIHS